MNRDWRAMMMDSIRADVAARLAAADEGVGDAEYQAAWQDAYRGFLRYLVEGML
jgi:hypothetical protein